MSNLDRGAFWLGAFWAGYLTKYWVTYLGIFG